VYSTEIPGEVKLLPLDEDEFKKGSVKELGAFDDFRVRILPVLGPLPAIFGLHAATYITLDLAGKPLTDAAAIKNRKKLYASMQGTLAEREAKIFGEHGLQTIELNTEDMALVLEDINCGRTTIPNALVTPKPTAIRWDRDQPLAVDNLVILSHKDAVKHEKEHLVGGKPLVEVWGQDSVDIAKRRNEETRRAVIYRRG
jgi:hypothetical protein